jgi:hypothetical protein
VKGNATYRSIRQCEKSKWPTAPNFMNEGNFVSISTCLLLIMAMQWMYGSSENGIVTLRLLGELASRHIHHWPLITELDIKTF